MPNKAISINKIRQVLRCYASGNGTKSISSMLSISRNTIKKYLHIYQKSGLDLKDILFWDDSSLCSLFRNKRNSRKKYLPVTRNFIPFFDYSKRLKKKGVMRNQLFKEYQSIHSYGKCRNFIWYQQRFPLDPF